MNKPWEPQGEGQSGGRTQDVRSRIGQECNHSEVRRGAFLREQDNTATAFEPSLFFFFKWCSCSGGSQGNLLLASVSCAGNGQKAKEQL